MQRMKTAVIALVLALGLSGMAAAKTADGWLLEDGIAAAKRGDFAKALLIWRPLAEQGNFAAQYNLGVSYEFGNGVEQNHATAAMWYRRAADQGYADAQANLGILFETGRGVQQNYVESVRWYDKAAAQGHARAQYNLGIAYEFGQGAAKDHVEAAIWYRKAANQGYASAQSNLGLFYERGQGVRQSDAEAVKWHTLAADQGKAGSQYSLGRMYAKGKVGGKQALVQAYKWLKLAAAGFPENSVYRSHAVKNLQKAASQMTPAQQTEAENLVRMWQPKKP